MLLDVNICLALVWSGHAFHTSVRKWYTNQMAVSRSLYLCRISQLGLLRLLSHRSVMGDAVLTQQGAWSVYLNLLQAEGMRFVREPDDFEAIFIACSSRAEVSPKRWTDDYLLAFAEKMEVPLVTLDRALANRIPNSILLS